MPPDFQGFGCSLDSFTRSATSKKLEDVSITLPLLRRG